MLQRGSQEGGLVGPSLRVTLCKNIACVQYGTVDATYDFTSQTK
jgi:hypothetical protein